MQRVENININIIFLLIKRDFIKIFFSLHELVE